MPEQNSGKKPRFGGSFLRVLVAALFLAFTLSSGMVGFLMGQRASRSTGQMVDTIVLSPGEDGAVLQRDTLHFLTGRVLRANGDPWAGVTVQLKEEDRSDVTDSRGKFYFSNMRSGSHTLEVLDEAGQVVSGLELQLDFNEEDQVFADLAGDPVVFRMPEDARMLEVTLTVEEPEEGQETAPMTVGKETAYFVTRDGQVVDFKGGALQIQEDSWAVTSQGNLVDSVGYVLLPSQAIVITPRGQEVEVPAEEESVSGLVLEEDGAVLVEQGATLLTTGEVELPGGELVGGEDKIVLITEDEVEELEELPEEYVPYQVRRLTAVTAASVEPDQAAGETEEPEAAEDAQVLAAEAEPTPTPEPTEGLVMRDLEGNAITPADTSVATWRQQSTIDLFKERTAGGDLGEEDGYPLAAPGSKGVYQFRLENPEEYDIIYSFSIQEMSIHLPIRYSVLNAKTNKSYLYRERLDEGTTLVSDEITIRAGETMELKIKWEWAYEDWFNWENDDLADLAAATGQDRTYLVAVDLNARQATTLAEPSGEGIKYPGRR